jgi:hypothetical protein
MNQDKSTCEANICLDHPNKPKYTEDEPPSKMPKIVPTNFGLSTMPTHEQKPNLYIYSEGIKYSNVEHKTKHEKHDEHAGKDIDLGGCQQENIQFMCS